MALSSSLDPVDLNKCLVSDPRKKKIIPSGSSSSDSSYSNGYDNGYSSDSYDSGYLSSAKRS